MSKRDKQLKISVSQEELEQIKQGAAKAGKSMAGYIIDKCNGTIGDSTIENGTIEDGTIEDGTSTIDGVPNDAVQPRVPKVRSDKHKGAWVQARREGRFKGTYEDYHDSMERY